MQFNQAPQGEQDRDASAAANPGSNPPRLIRARLVLIATGAALVASVLAGCGQKGPLTLPKPVDATVDPARKPAKP
jgi:predicted small lipoprotein YifL